MNNQINENEKNLVESLINFLSTVYKLLNYLAESNIDSYYDEENSLFVILDQHINESISLNNCKKYAESKLDPGICKVVIKK